MKLKRLLGKTAKNATHSSQGGYTIIEGLVAMIVVAILMSAVAPVIVFSVGTRVQARRIELGARAARNYIDSVRNNPNNGPGRTSILDFNDFDPPDPTTDIEGCVDGDYCDETANKNLYCVDGDGDGKCNKASLTDMIIQAASRNRVSGFEIDSSGGFAVNDPSHEMGYKMLVRVYRADAFQETTLCAGRGEEETEDSGCPKVTEQSATTSGIGNRRLPVTQMITEISPTEDSFNNLRDRIIEETTTSP